MELLLLGPVELRAAGRAVPLGGARQRGVVAALAADAGRPVPVDTLIDRVWGLAPPGRARHALQAYIARIRGVLRAHAQGTAVAHVIRRSGGYELDMDPADVDVFRFRSLVDQARDADRSDRLRVRLLRQALDLWRGPPLCGQPGDWAARVGQGWQRQHQDAVLAWADACLRLDEPEPVVTTLTDLVGDQPLAEPLAAGLIRALCASGRPAEGLYHYERVRRLLAEELGADPGPELRGLHRRILAGDPALCRPAGPSVPARVGRPAHPAHPDRPPVPRLLPAPPQLFSGRRRELSALECAPDADTVVIVAIDGMAGVGKTALALHAAHQLAERFPDGQLFIDLHGYTAGLRPVGPGDALDRMLRMLGIPGGQIPADLDERAALYRSRLAGTRMLILLDNAATEGQAAPLLPGSPGCLALITSRQHLAGLDRTHTVHLDTLSPADAVTLFARAVGDARTAAAPPALLEETVGLCGGLPLAVRIAAARLRSHPAWTVTHLLERLRDHQHRLAELAAGERSVTTTLDLSYQQLGADGRHLYGCLGLHPGPDIDPYAAAALAGRDPIRARRLMELLLDAHLLQEPIAGRYAFHDLVRAHAGHTAATTSGTDARAALTRLLDYYRHAAATAMDAAYPYERDRRPAVPPAAAVLPALAEPAAAAGWLDRELPNLLAGARLAGVDGWPEHAWQLSAILHRHLRTRGRYRDADTLHRKALTTARATGNRDGELHALIAIGDLRLMQGRYEQAVDHHGRALQVARSSGNRAGELYALLGLGEGRQLQAAYEPALGHYGRALEIAEAIGDATGRLYAMRNLGNLHRFRGRYGAALDHYRRALDIARATGNRAGELDALRCIGDMYGLMGRHDETHACYAQVLEIARETGNRAGELIALNGVGRDHQRHGRYQQALEHHALALAIARATGHRLGELTALLYLGDAHRLLGRPEPAAEHYRHLLDQAREIGDRNLQFEAIYGLAQLHHAHGRADLALALHGQALRLATQLEQPAELARAHDGLARAHHALSQAEPARHHWQQAMTILLTLHTDHTEDDGVTIPAIRAHLAALSGPAAGSRSP